MIDALKAGIDPATLFSHLEEFARREKLSGTPEEFESFLYLKAQLDEMGYATELIRHDAYISLPGSASLEAGGTVFDCITHSFSMPHAAGLTAPVVYLDRGSEEDFARHDVRGRIVLVDGLASPAISRRATAAGAVGQIHVSVHEHKHEMCISPVWGSPSDENLHQMPGTVVLTVSRADGERLKAMLREGALQATLRAEVDTGWRKIPLLTADMPGAAGVDDEPFVLLSGHHDTWYLGVMDNGAANATMLEVARLAIRDRASWRRGLRLCFWSGHSHGRYAGSAWYAETRWQELEKRCVAHVNADSTGGRGNEILSDMAASAELRAFAGQVVRDTGGQELSGLRMSRAGDQSFWGIGVPSLFNTAGEQSPSAGENVAAAIFSGGGRAGAGFGWWWHTPGDTLDKIDAEILVRDTAIYLHAVWRLLTDPVLPLDYVDYADDLTGELAKLEAAAARGVDPAPALQRASELKDRAIRLKSAIGAMTADGTGAADAANATLARISRHLVPIDYTTGDRFGQDPALGQAPFPVLDPLRRLAAAEPGSAQAQFAAVAARRGLNRVLHALDGAIGEFDALLARASATAAE